MPPPPLPMRTPARGSPAPKAGIVPRLACGDDAEQRGPRIALRIGTAAVFLVAVEGRRIPDGDRRHPGGHLAGIGRDVELRDGLRAAAAAADVLPEPLAADAERRHDADAGDHDAGLFETSPKAKIVTDVDAPRSGAKPTLPAVKRSSIEHVRSAA